MIRLRLKSVFIDVLKVIVRSPTGEILEIYAERLDPEIAMLASSGTNVMLSELSAYTENLSLPPET